MSVESEFRDLLADDAGVSALVGSRIYWVLAQEGAARPLIVLQMISHFPIHDEDGGMFVTRRVQVSCLADTYLETLPLSDAVREALNGYAGELLGSPPEASTIQAILLLDESEGLEFEADEYRHDLDFQVQYTQ